MVDVVFSEAGNAAHARMSAADYQRVVHDWNETGVQFPDICTHELFEQQVARDPEAVAVVFQGMTLSYRELNARANQLAHYLQRRHVGPEDLVGICLNRSPAMVVGLLGVWKAGAAYVPLDPAYPPERLAFMVRDAGLQLLLTDRPSRILFDATDVEAICLDAEARIFADESRRNPVATATPANLAYVMYTSGSTGQPKGAMILHRGLSNYLCWAIKAYRLTAGESVPVHSSMAFDLTVTSLYPPLLVGGQVELLAEDMGAQNLLASLRQGRKPNLVKITPAHLEILGRLLKPEEMAQMSQAFVIGGENLPAETLRPWRQHAPGTRLINEYGPTETVVGCCIHEVRPDDPQTGPVPIGRPIANTRLYVLDSALQPVPPGVIGELYIGGAGVARGYLNRPQLNAERFLNDPFADEPTARLYKSGDLARYRPDGILEYLGRTDDQVKLRGYRIELAEIEAGLLAHPGIQSAAVLAREDQAGNRQLAAYLCRHQAAATPAGAGDLQEFLKQQLPAYMVPAHFVFLDALPLTPNGKVDRQALPAPSYAATTPPDQFAAPRTKVETTLATIFRELLKRERVGRDDDFFDLGGHSLLAIKAVSRIRDTFKVELKIQALFAHPRIAELAQQLAAAGVGQEAPPQIRPRPAAADAPLSFGQEHLWFLEQLSPGNIAYNIVDMIPLDGPYDALALQAALQELARRHEVLRTVFCVRNGRPVQTVLPLAEPVLAERDLSSLPQAAQHEEWQRLVRERGRQAFDLSRSPPLDWLMVHLSDREHRLLLTIHHLIADEWSMARIQQEVRQRYAAFVRGRNAPNLPHSPLVDLPIQYADFACWQRNWLQGEVRQRQVDYWKAELAGANPTLALPVDKPRPELQSFRGETEHFALPEDLAARLKALGRQEQATLFMVLEAAFAALLYRCTGQDDILVGTPITNRTQSETENLVGYFLNTLVLRARFAPAMSFRSLLRQVRERSLGAYAHAELPFQQLVAEIGAVRDPSRCPLFQVMFVLHDSEGVSQVSRMPGKQSLSNGSAKFDLTLFVAENGNQMAAAVEYCTDLFEKETILEFSRNLVSLLEAIASNPEACIDELALTPVGKNDRWLLPASVPIAASIATVPLPPRTQSETRILDIFRQVLGRGDFGVLDNFFDLGGHSLMATEIVSRIQDEAGVDLPLRNLFERPTVAGLAEVVDGLSWLARSGAAAPLTHAIDREEIAL